MYWMKINTRLAGRESVHGGLLLHWPPFRQNTTQSQPGTCYYYTLWIGSRNMQPKSRPSCLEHVEDWNYFSRNFNHNGLQTSSMTGEMVLFCSLFKCLSAWTMKAVTPFIFVREGTSNYKKNVVILWIAQWAVWETKKLYYNGNNFLVVILNDLIDM